MFLTLIKKPVALFLFLCYNILILSYITPLGVIIYKQSLYNKSYNKEDPKGSSNIVYNKIYKYSKDKYISEAIANNSNYPITLAAIAKVESDYRPQAIGDSGDSIGMFQIQPKHHGAVPNRVPEQVKKADKIFSGLVKQHGYYEAIKRYNGSGKQAEQYRNKVLKIVQIINTQQPINNS